MKKLSINFAGLVLFLVTFAPGMVVGMKELPELKSRVLGEYTPSLPQDVKKIIASKTLRVILDEAQDDPGMLMKVSINERERWLRRTNELNDNPTFWNVFFESEPKPDIRPIDMIILLIENGADPKTKNYMGNTVFSLLMNYFVNMAIPWVHDGVFRDNVGELGSTLKLLARRKVNFNQILDDEDSTTAAFKVLMRVLVSAHYIRSKRLTCYSLKENLKTAWSFIFLLKDLGVDFTTIKDAIHGKTACEMGQEFSEEAIIDDYSKKQLNILCSPPSKGWSFFK